MENQNINAIEGNLSVSGILFAESERDEDAQQGENDLNEEFGEEGEE